MDRVRGDVKDGLNGSGRGCFAGFGGIDIERYISGNNDGKSYGFSYSFVIRL